MSNKFTYPVEIECGKVYCDQCKFVVNGGEYHSENKDLCLVFNKELFHSDYDGLPQKCSECIEAERKSKEKENANKTPKKSSNQIINEGWPEYLKKITDPDKTPDPLVLEFVKDAYYEGCADMFYGLKSELTPKEKCSDEMYAVLDCLSCSSGTSSVEHQAILAILKKARGEKCIKR